MIEQRTEAVDAIAARRSLSRGGTLEDAARAALAAIGREAQERAAPYLDVLVRAAALRPAAPLVVAFCGGCAQAIIPDALLGTRCGCNAAPVDRAPFSRADQVREALREAFSDAPAIVAGMLAPLLDSATDAQLERLNRLLK